jgi:deoxycytidylate deaminase
MLKYYAPLRIWAEAVTQARRSSFNRHKTGAVLFDGDFLATGCSHKHNGSYSVNSIHAERHALSRWYMNTFPFCVVVTLTKAGNFASCSRPCRDCAVALQNKGCGVIYAEQTNDGGWAIREVAWDMLTEGYLKPTRYA